jgi:predicted regulator of Ras-like GTPase activity (Roadblock/LC7/MglB family)
MLETISQRQNQYIESLLTSLIAKAEGQAVFMCDRAGNILAQQCNQTYVHEDNIAALASGSFFATRVLAELLGETEFHHVIHQGAKASMYMQVMDCDMLILVVFGPESNPGLVRLYCSETCRAIDQYLASEYMLKRAGARSPVAHRFELDKAKQPFTRTK